MRLCVYASLCVCERVYVCGRERGVRECMYVCARAHAGNVCVRERVFVCVRARDERARRR